MPSAAAAPARKPPQTTTGELGAVIALMRAMGARSFDPMPPDQHAWQASAGEPPLYRLWSWMCAHTIAFGRRSAHAIRDDGRPAKLRDAERDLAIDHAELSRAWSRGEKLGLWRRESHGQAGRLHLSGHVDLAQIEGAKKKSSRDCTVTLSKAELSVVDSWPAARRAEFLKLWGEWQGYRRDALAEAVFRAREASDRIEDTIRGRFGLEKKRAPVAREPILVPAAVEALIGVTVQTPAVQPLPVRSLEAATVQSPPSILTSEEDRREPNSSSSVVVSQSDDDQGIFPEVKSWMRLYSQRSGRDLGEPDAQIVKRVIRGMNGVSLEHLARLLRRLHTKGLKPASSYGWIAAVVEEEFRDGLSAERNANAGGA